MTLPELISRMDQVVAQIPSLILRNTELAALDLLQAVDARITETGKSATGTPFDDYTPAYKAKKTKLGRYTGKVDFTLSGQMLASTSTGFENIAPTEKTVSNGKAKITFGGRDELTRKKLDGNNKYRPGFLQPSVAEVRGATKNANKNMEYDVAEILGL
jgi:hypothetical protein